MQVAEDGVLALVREGDDALFADLREGLIADGDLVHHRLRRLWKRMAGGLALPPVV